MHVFLFFLNRKFYSPAVTTPLQKAANWAASVYILCSLGGGGGGEYETKEKKARDFTSPASQTWLSHSCNVAAAPLRFATHTKAWAFLRGVLVEVWKKLYQKWRFRSIGARRARDVSGLAIYGSISMQRWGDDTAAFAAWLRWLHCLHFVGIQK